MTNEKITAMPVKKTQIHLTATLSLTLRLHERAWILTGSRSLSTSLVQQILEVSQDGVVFELKTPLLFDLCSPSGRD